MRLAHTRYLITAFTQPLGLGQPLDDLGDFDQRFRRIIRRHLAILGWWGLLHLAAGIGALFLSPGFWHYFLLMGLVWGAINLGLAVLIFYHALFKKFQQGNSFARFEAQRHVEKFLLFNLGLDVAYGCSALGLLGLGCSSAVPKLWEGFGWAVMLQAVFLLIQDGWVYLLHQRNFAQAAPYLREVLETTVPKRSHRREL